MLLVDRYITPSLPVGMLTILFFLCFNCSPALLELTRNASLSCFSSPRENFQPFCTEHDLSCRLFMDGPYYLEVVFPLFLLWVFISGEDIEFCQTPFLRKLRRSCGFAVHFVNPLYHIVFRVALSLRSRTESHLVMVHYPWCAAEISLLVFCWLFLYQYSSEILISFIFL